MTERLGELLVKRNYINPEQLKKALEEQKLKGGRLESNLVRLGYIKEDELLSFLSAQYRVPSVKISKMEINPNVIKLVPSSISKKYFIIPINRMGPKLTLAMSDPSNIVVIDEIKFMTGFNVEPVVASETEIIDAIKKYYGGGGNVAGMGSVSFQAADFELDDEKINASGDGIAIDDVVDLDDFDKLVHGAVDNVEVVEAQQNLEDSIDMEGPIIKIVNGILIKAIKLGASDIHFEPYERTFRVRYRIDGVMRRDMSLPIQIKNAMTSRLKIMARLDIAEKRLPQDGRIKLRLGKGREMDFRVSTIPILFGEKVVLRLLDKSALQLDMTKLGFEESSLVDLKASIHKPVGMILVTGPTGSGKTTTLYSALSELNKETENIITAEDPIEYNFMGINQVQMHEEIGLTFASALRSFLRQDPDIIMVGEIRDFETAQIAVQASLTGHLVLSTVHTNDAPGTITRLIDMGIEPFLISSAVILILAQRLIRKICMDCREPVKVHPQLLIDLGIPPDEVKSFQVYKGKGCPICNNTGYKGRIGLYEVMPMREEVKELVLSRASTSEIKKEAMRLGMKTLRQSGVMKIKDGVTTIEEVLRSTIEDR
ncbi:MAG: type IV-A pilus assembly ATPase PilB [Deltaproteobacteria bacterium CG_4_8_14_3_um_filter_45_9]|nr:MAG: type IV-A pilus assembly ATPase PilB [Deltaproteobacteria bacterium CG03_land_8_20_14_0_80_45_14]PIX21310.1 MAG: type IV-A pilus assembly ATPase PilB [Deltaproteobacteria bacterium CG_4_8_14_3_um_filter_45_9]